MFMKNDRFFVALCLVVIFALGSIKLFGSINNLEPVKAGNELQMFINLKNPTDLSLGDMKIRAVFYDIGEYAVSSDFTLGGTHGIEIDIPVPKNAVKGDHIVKIIASNKDAYDSQFVYFKVI
jgi:hypothetical protein